MPTWQRSPKPRTVEPVAVESSSTVRPFALGGERQAPRRGEDGSARAAPAAVVSRLPVPNRKITPPKKVISSRDELPRPQFERLFGDAEGKTRIADAVRTAAAGLIHVNGTVTVLITPEQAHILQTFVQQIEDKGFKVEEVVFATSDLILGLYNDATSEEARRSANTNTGSAESRKVLDDVIARAMAAKASDIQIDVLGDAKPPVGRVFYRIHGKYILQQDLLTNAITAGAVSRAAYTGEQADAASRSETSFKTNTGIYATLQIPHLQNVRLRLQTMPHVHGYGLNLRILSFDGLSSRYPDLVAMGFSQEHQKDIVESFETENGGLILFIASTGMGKTTTVMTAVPMERHFHERKWVSIEDPVELINPDIFQSPIRRSTGNKDDDSEHQAAMTNVLRFDPDGIIAGEIRDEITVRLAERAAMTGHLTAATLHGNDPFVAFNRLIDLGARKLNLLDGVARLFVHQKLVQTLCLNCAPKAVQSKDPATKHFLSQLQATYGDLDVKNIRLQGCGCEKCHPKGHQLAGINGRTIVAETVRFNKPIIDALRNHEDTDVARRVWRQQRVAEYNEPGTMGKTLGEHALYKLLIGEISPATYESVTDTFDSHSPMPIQSSRGQTDATQR